MDVIDTVVRRQAEIAALRRDLHAHPETAFEEHRTAGIVAGFLQRLGLEVHTGIARTGVVAALRAGSGGRAIGLRADMDALPLTELNTFAHRSTHPGRMHACGHDGHTAMLLGAAEQLAATRRFDGTVYFIFQPAEEGQGGGREMVEAGLFERFPMEQVFGLHNWPGLPAGTFGVHSGPVMASADEFEIVLTGRGGHAAMPHLTRDPIVAGAALVQSLQHLVSRELDPVEAGVVSVTQFHAGEAYNVVPEQALLRGTVRAFRPAVRDQLEAGLSRVAAALAQAHGIDAQVRYQRGYPPTINHAGPAAQCAATAAELVGPDKVFTDLAPTMGAEDFAFMLERKPGCYVWLGAGSEGGCMLHNPHFDFNDAIIPVGVSYWVRLVERLLE